MIVQDDTDQIIKTLRLYLFPFGELNFARLDAVYDELEQILDKVTKQAPNEDY